MGGLAVPYTGTGSVSLRGGHDPGHLDNDLIGFLGENSRFLNSGGTLPANVPFWVPCARRSPD